MDLIRLTANSRAEFAREKWNEILSSFTSVDTIAGVKARKLAQAYNIYLHYLFVFNGSIPRGTAVYNVMEYNIKRRKKNQNFKSRRYLNGTK
jgi:hypothetical protein